MTDSELLAQGYVALPMLPLRGLHVFPGMMLTFDVERPASITALERAVKNNQVIFLTAQQKGMLTFCPPTENTAPNRATTQTVCAPDAPFYRHSITAPWQTRFVRLLNGTVKTLPPYLTAAAAKGITPICWRRPCGNKSPAQDWPHLIFRARV